MSRGGSRPGAGAPRNNLNALKEGGFSGQLKQSLYEGTPVEWHEFLARLKDDWFRAHVNMSSTLSFLSSASSGNNTESRSSK
jgi:hypothetical protein